MGLPYSRVTQSINENNIEKTSSSSSPILTPRTSRKSEIDPRSPSTHISRTPVELDSFTIEEHEIQSGEVFFSPMKNLLENHQLDPRSPTTAFLRTPVIFNNSKNNLLCDYFNNCVKTPVKSGLAILELDPRSPTVDFVRTPIIVESSEDDLRKTIQNKNLEKIRHLEVYSTPVTKKEQPAPKLLRSSPIKPRAEVYKRKSLAGVLETNIDFTETDIDAVLRDKCRIKDCSIETIEGELLSQNQSIEKEIQQPVSTDDVIVKQVVDLIVEEDKCGKFDLNKDCTGESCEILNENLLCDISEVKSAPLTPNRMNLDELNKMQSILTPASPPLGNVSTDVKEFDKKLTNLIYEDQDIIVCPRIVQLKDVLERSPLKSRNSSNLQPKKSAQKLKVSDKPRKSEYIMSKIPVFKQKVQCENTPPQHVENKNKNAKKSHWDSKDLTVYL